MGAGSQGTPGPREGQSPPDDFPSWARLRRYVEVVERYSRFPERMAAASPADEFLRLACLYYDDDQPGRWAQAKAILLARNSSSSCSNR